MNYVAIAERIVGERRVIAQYPSMINQAHAIVRNALSTTTSIVNSLNMRMHTRKSNQHGIGHVGQGYYYGHRRFAYRHHCDFLFQVPHRRLWSKNRCEDVSSVGNANSSLYAKQICT
jgi:hypothetical protein